MIEDESGVLDFVAGLMISLRERRSWILPSVVGGVALKGVVLRNMLSEISRSGQDGLRDRLARGLP